MIMANVSKDARIKDMALVGYENLAGSPVNGGTGLVLALACALRSIVTRVTRSEEDVDVGTQNYSQRS